MDTGVTPQIPTPKDSVDPLATLADINENQDLTLGGEGDAGESVDPQAMGSLPPVKSDEANQGDSTHPGHIQDSQNSPSEQSGLHLEEDKTNFAMERLGGAEVDDEDTMLTEARGAKGRPEADAAHTPDRGNVNHIPVCATLQLLNTSEDAIEKKSSYFKIDSRILRQAEIKAKIQSIWEAHETDEVDARKKWSKAWSRVRDYCKELHQQFRVNDKIQAMRKEVNDRRRYLPYDCSDEEMQELTEMEDTLQGLEDQNAAQWYLRSRSKWLKDGEAPTKFFFKLAKARFKGDKIAALNLETGETVTRREDILKLVEEYYIDLYNADSEGLTNRLVLQLIDRRISEEEGSALDNLPTDEEIDNTVKSLKWGKSPGLDGVTNDMLLDCWDFIRQDCYEMVMAFWMACHRRRFKFLGIWSGRGISQKEITEKVVETIEKKFKLWANMYLSFTSRILLIKHVLSAIPVHYLMTVGFDSKGIDKINRTIRQFLWGLGPGGKPKVSLIGWHKLNRSKEEGGLGWKELQLRMKAHLAGKILRLLGNSGAKTGWMRLASAIIIKHCSSGSRKTWTCQEILLLNPGLTIKQAPMLTRMLRSWSAAKKILTLDRNNVQIPVDLTYDKLEAVLTTLTPTPKASVTTARRWARRLKWKTLADMITEAGTWKSVEDELIKLSWFPEELDKRMMTELWSPIWNGNPTTVPLEDINSWSWKFHTNNQDYRTARSKGILLGLCDHASREGITPGRQNGIDILPPQNFPINSLKQLIKIGLTNNSQATLVTSIAAEWIKFTWKERNACHFANKKSSARIAVIFQLARQNLTLGQNSNEEIHGSNLDTPRYNSCIDG
ncbi:hypothetical protein R1sor_006944 [Riccia sorocarpa]|uniref:Uncharacterized protein n=1 Tax=Riccia sorocarpa TaxID=122646 RepID=A0ABD3HPF1_9MARC